MAWIAVVGKALVAALALPVVGLATGRVVGDLYRHGRDGDPMGIAGAFVGLGVYLVALASSYAHLRNYYSQFEGHRVKASWAMALAIEVSTFYMSAAYVLYGSPWAFWGSLLGAFVVFWGNLDSMLRGILASRQSAEEAEASRNPAPREAVGERREPGASRRERPVEPMPDLAPAQDTQPGFLPVPSDASRRLEAEPPSPPQSPPPALNGGHERTQADILELARMGLSKREIAERLQMPEATLNFHLSRLARRGLVRLQGEAVYPA